MERPMTRSSENDRRRAERSDGHVIAMLQSAQIRPGHVAQVIHWSAQGTLVETGICLMRRPAVSRG